MPLKGRKGNKNLKVTRKIPNHVFHMMFSRYRPSGSVPLCKLLNSRHFRIHWLSANMNGEKSQTLSVRNHNYREHFD